MCVCVIKRDLVMACHTLPLDKEKESREMTLPILHPKILSGRMCIGFLLLVSLLFQEEEYNRPSLNFLKVFFLLSCHSCMNIPSPLTVELSGHLPPP